MGFRKAAHHEVQARSDLLRIHPAKFNRQRDQPGTVHVRHCLGGNAAAILATNAVNDFSIRNNTAVLEYGVTPTHGVQIAANCDHYVVTGNNLRRATTPLDITPADSADRRIVANNVIL